MKPTHCSECGREPLVARGFCNRCYRRWQRHGSPSGGGSRRSEFALGTIEYLMDCSEEQPGPLETPCRVWTRATTEAGYGLHGVSGGKKGKTTYAHMTAWRLRHGAIPPGAYVCHRCDVRACVNADHLFLGDALANNRDAKAKGRAGQGHNRRVTAEELDQMVTLRSQGWTCVALAREFGFSAKHISRITHRKDR